MNESLLTLLLIAMLFGTEVRIFFTDFHKVFFLSLVKGRGKGLFKCLSALSDQLLVFFNTTHKYVCKPQIIGQECLDMRGGQVYVYT